MSKLMRSILVIEYEYVRVYVNCVALQAVIERCAQNVDDSGAVSREAMLSIYTGNERYIKEVIAASRSILHTVVDDLLPDENLKHVPVRTYTRVLAGAMFLLKVDPLVSVRRVKIR